MSGLLIENTPGLAIMQAAPALTGGGSGIGVQGLASVMIVLALLAGLAWLARRGTFKNLRSRARAMAVETALPLGERRSLVIVGVEGRRLLLGLTPGNVSFVTELAAGAPFEEELERQQKATQA
jgi:flagellar protein FliO/FliZ